MPVNRPAVALLLLAALGVSATPAAAENFTGRVVAVDSGDALALSDAKGILHRLRLSGIDAPDRLQPFGGPASAALSARALNRQATADCRDRSFETRPVCVVRVGGEDLGLAQVRDGMAWWDTRHATEQSNAERNAYSQAEFNAKVRRLGLWAAKNPTPPWDWRRGREEDR